MISPRPNFVIIRRAENVSKIGLIHLPDSSIEVPSEGTVVCAGDDCILEPDDDVIFGSYAGEEFPDPDEPGEWLILMAEKHVLARLH